MRLTVTTDAAGRFVVRDAQTGEPLVGVWRVELRADNAIAAGRAQLVLFLDPTEHAVKIEAATVTTEHRPRPAGHFGRADEE